MSLWDNVKEICPALRSMTITMITARMTITSMIMKNLRSLLPPAAKPRRAAPLPAPKRKREGSRRLRLRPHDQHPSAAPAAGFLRS